jgi:hypothetical protein
MGVKRAGLQSDCTGLALLEIEAVNARDEFVSCLIGLMKNGFQMGLPREDLVLIVEDIEERIGVSEVFTDWVKELGSRLLNGDSPCH